MLEFANYIGGMPFAQILGLIGFGCYIVGFGALQLGLINGNGSAFPLVTMLGAVLVLVSLANAEAASAALILFQICWIVVGLTGFIMRFFRSWDEAVKSAIRPKAG